MKPPKELKILCPFCNAPYTAQMQEELEGWGGGCDTCDYGSGASVTIEITCSNCGRVVYRKEATTD